MKTIQDYINDALEKIDAGLNAEHDYCVNKDKDGASLYLAHANEAYKAARTAVKKVFNLFDLDMPKDVTTIFMCEKHFNTFKIHYYRFWANLHDNIE